MKALAFVWACAIATTTTSAAWALTPYKFHPLPSEQAWKNCGTIAVALQQSANSGKFKDVLKEHGRTRRRASWPR